MIEFNRPAEPLAPTFEAEGDVHNGRVSYFNSTATPLTQVTPRGKSQSVTNRNGFIKGAFS